MSKLGLPNDPIETQVFFRKISSGSDDDFRTLKRGLNTASLLIPLQPPKNTVTLSFTELK
jgi:hypothetical protein